MVHGGYGKRKISRHKPELHRRPKGMRIEKKGKHKTVSLKNQIRSIERILRKELPLGAKEAQESKLQGMKKQLQLHNRLEMERKMFLRDRKIKFFERRKTERRIRRLEKLQRASSSQAEDAEISEHLSKLKEDLEYIRFFPKTEKYVSLFTGSDDSNIVDRRNKLRKQIKANLVSAAAKGKDLEETGSEDDWFLDVSDDDFFLAGSSSDEANADDEWTDKSTRDQASSASGKAISSMSSDERNQIFSRARLLPPRPLNNTSVSAPPSRFMVPSSKKSVSASCNASNTRAGHQSSNLSSNSEARKPRRKRRPKKRNNK